MINFLDIFLNFLFNAIGFSSLLFIVGMLLFSLSKESVKPIFYSIPILFFGVLSFGIANYYHYKIEEQKMNQETNIYKDNAYSLRHRDGK